MKRAFSNEISDDNLKRFLTNYLYLLPIIGLVLFIFLYPIAYGVYISFTNFSLQHFFNATLIGFQNYETLFRTGVIYPIILQTLIWTVGSIIPMVLLGMLVATILNQKGFKLKVPIFTVILLPWAFPAFISLLIWVGMWNTNFGIINQFLALLGIAKVNWLFKTVPAWGALIITNLWLSFSYYTTFFLSSMQSVPDEFHESAKVDGANMFQRFSKITWPSIKGAVAFASISGFIYTWNNFYPIYLLTGGGPGTSTYSLTVYSYSQAFSFYNYSLGAALSVVSVIILAIMAVFMLKYTKVLDMIS
jgi:arabinogalactan oligomer/maltooligosaccharide transport system permease protein